MDLEVFQFKPLWRKVLIWNWAAYLMESLLKKKEKKETVSCSVPFLRFFFSCQSRAVHMLVSCLALDVLSHSESKWTELMWIVTACLELAAYRALFLSARPSVRIRAELRQAQRHQLRNKKSNDTVKSHTFNTFTICGISPLWSKHSKMTHFRYDKPGRTCGETHLKCAKSNAATLTLAWRRRPMCGMLARKLPELEVKSLSRVTKV